jgi:hypothetical protein
MKMLRTVACAGALLATQVAQADNWPQWRGARHDGISTEQQVPTRWTPSDGVAWRLKLPGRAEIGRAHV